jgi:hypothetical protein
MQALFGHVLDSYVLIKEPVEPHASNPIAQAGMYWLIVTGCNVRRRNRHFHAQIQLMMINADLHPPFEAVYELKRKLTYGQLCGEFAKLRVILHHPNAWQEACKSVIGTVGYANCLPDDAPAGMDQAAILN